jgi:hypothetical protein
VRRSLCSIALRHVLQDRHFALGDVHICSLPPERSAAARATAGEFWLEMALPSATIFITAITSSRDTSLSKNALAPAFSALINSCHCRRRSAR